MSDYIVKIRIPLNDDEYRFDYSHFGSESSEFEIFKHLLFDGVWQTGFSHPDWMGADKVWIFVLKEEIEK